MLQVLDDNRNGSAPLPAVFSEREFGAVFKRAERKGNTLSSYIRDAWDDGILANSTKSGPVQIADHHISICAHITPAELKRLLSDVDVANGFSNRFLWIYTQRTKLRPGARGFQAERHAAELTALRGALDTAMRRFEDASEPIEIPFTPRARDAWVEYLYSELTIDDEDDSQLTLMCNRQPQQVCRIATVFAIADGNFQIDLPHLQSAQALTAYVRDSLDYILSRPWWGDSSKPNASAPEMMAPKVLEALKAGPLKRSEITHDVFKRHRTQSEVNDLRDLLVQQRSLRITYTGRAEIWNAL
jgi:hypothetical protein